MSGNAQKLSASGQVAYAAGVLFLDETMAAGLRLKDPRRGRPVRHLGLACHGHRSDHRELSGRARLPHRSGQGPPLSDFLITTIISVLFLKTISISKTSFFFR